jgi:2-oxoglutarate ferredoxin oxidoreductase subunit alpha
MSVDTDRIDFGPVPEKDWALDGTKGGTGQSRLIWSWDMGKSGRRGLGPDGQWKKIAAKFAALETTEARHDSFEAEDARYLVVSWGTTSPFVDYVVEELRADGISIGAFRPISLWPFPEAALREAAVGAEKVFTYEINAGQMLDDVRLAVEDHRKVVPLGGVSVDYSGMRQGDLLSVSAIRDALLGAIRNETPDPVRSL